MVTSYRIEVGYNASQQRENVWSALKEVVDELRDNRQRIVDEVLRLEPEADVETIKDVAECYKKSDDEDLTIRIVDSNDPNIEPWIDQLASGGNPGRDAKESCRRAVCRLVMQELHRRKMEINIIVC